MYMVGSLARFDSEGNLIPAIAKRKGRSTDTTSQPESLSSTCGSTGTTTTETPKS
jgi:hypothetical protein